MASPVGHALAGYAVARFGERAEGPGGPALWIAGAVLAVAPDFDFLPGILAGQPALHHQGASHSFAAALLVSGATAWVLFRGRGQVLQAWPILFLAYASHFLFDFLGPDARPPIGIPLFWPLSDATFLSATTLLPGISHAGSTSTATSEWVSSVLSWYNVRAVLIEVAVAGPLVVMAELRHRWLRRDDARAPREGRS